MTDRSTRDTQYVLVREPKARQPTRYYLADDDSSDSEEDTPRRRVVQRKPAKEQRIRYVTADEPESDHRRIRLTESKDRSLKVRNANTGEQIILDEDDNIIKVVRNSRSRTPSLVKQRHYHSRPRVSRPVYYETSDGRLVARHSKNQPTVNLKNDFVYAEEEPTQIVRKVILDPRSGDRQTLYEQEKPKKIAQQKYIIRKRASDPPADSQNDSQLAVQPQVEQQPQYVQVVQRRVLPEQQEALPTKYVMVRKKLDSEPVQTLVSTVAPTTTTRRIVYQTAPKKPPVTYVYATDGNYYQ